MYSIDSFDLHSNKHTLHMYYSLLNLLHYYSIVQVYIIPHKHTDHTLKIKLEVLNKLKKGARAVDLCRAYNLSASTLSTWKHDRDKLERLASSGKVLDLK